MRELVTEVMHFHRYSPTLGKSGWWFAAACGCGWIGPDRSLEKLAAADAEQHSVHWSAWPPPRAAAQPQEEKR